MLVAPLARQGKSGQKVTPKEFAILRVFAEFYQRVAAEKRRFSGLKSIFFIKQLQLPVSRRAIEAFRQENEVFPHLPAGACAGNQLLRVLQCEGLDGSPVIESQGQPFAA